MPNLDTILQFILPFLLSYVAYLFGRKRDKTEIKKLEIEAKNLELESKKLELEAEHQEVETEKDELDLMDRTVDFYKTKMTEMLDEIEILKSQINELKEMIESLVNNQCKGDDCESKKELNKILAKRAARKKKTTN